MSHPSNWYEDPSILIDRLRRRSQEAGPSLQIAGYRDLHEIRRGGQGVVYRAIQIATGQRVAIKVIAENVLSSRSAKRRFEREIDLIATLRHPNIVRVYDSGETTDGRLYSVMEYIEGKPLDEHLAARGHADDRNALRELLALFAKVCEAIHHANQHGVVHRDLKPSNIRIDKSGEPHVLDFGLAKDTSSAAGSMDVTLSGQFMGSLPWASPEQAEGFPDGVDVRTDVYSLGVILFGMLTGRFPYDVSGSIRESLNQILTAEPKQPSSINHLIDNELETIVLKNLSKEPERRYQSAGDLATDIHRYLAGDPIEAKRDSATYVLRKNLEKYRWALGVAAAFVVVLAVSSIVTWATIGMPQRRQPNSRSRATTIRSALPMRTTSRTT